MANRVNAIAPAAITAPNARSGPDAADGRVASTATITATTSSVHPNQAKYACESPDAYGDCVTRCMSPKCVWPWVDDELYQLTAVNAMIARMSPIPAKVAPTTPNFAPLPIGLP